MGWNQGYCHPQIIRPLNWTLPARCKSSYQDRLSRKQNIEFVLDNHPNIRLISIRPSNMSSEPFKITLHSPGIGIKPIEVNRAYQTKGNTHILSLSAVKNCGLELEACSENVDQLHIVGCYGFDWRVKQSADSNWGSQWTIWYITDTPLPEGAQALVPTNSASLSSTNSTVAPVGLANKTAKERKDAAIREKQIKLQREKEIDDERRANVKKYEEAAKKSSQQRPKE